MFEKRTRESQSDSQIANTKEFRVTPKKTSYHCRYHDNNEFGRIVSTAYMKAKKRPNVLFDMGNERCDNIFNTWSAIR